MALTSCCCSAAAITEGLNAPVGCSAAARTEGLAEAASLQRILLNLVSLSHGQACKKAELETRLKSVDQDTQTD